MTYTATAENLDQALAFAQAVADYCHSQEDYANEVDDSNDAEAWGDAAGDANALVDTLLRRSSLLRPLVTAYAGRDWALAEAVPPGLLRDLLTALPHLAHEVNLALSCGTSYDGAARECFMMLVGVFRHLDDSYQPRCLPSIHFEGAEPGDLAHDSPGNRLARQLARQLVQDEEDSR